MRWDFAVAAACTAAILSAAGAACATGASAPPGRAQAAVFTPAPKDRPVLETVGQVRRARTTGAGEFDFGGVHYAIPDFPEEYIDYSAWCVRMP